MRGLLLLQSYTQIVYLKVPHWTEFPRVGWKQLSKGDRTALEANFKKCPLHADFIRGNRKLPPPIPGVFAYN